LKFLLDSGEDSYWGDNRGTGTLEQLKGFAVNLLPPQGVWATVAPGAQILCYVYDCFEDDLMCSEPLNLMVHCLVGVEFMQSHNENKGRGGDEKKEAGPTKRTIYYTLRATNPGGQEKIDKFLEVI
jgi:hypothetical protein